MSENKNPREYWLWRCCNTAVIYESLDEFPPDGDKSLLVHVREVIDETEQADASVRKYEFTGKTLNYDGAILRQIRRISDGEIGGWIESQQNLSHEGDCWVSNNALVYGDAKVYDNAIVCDDAKVCGDARVSGKAQVYGKALVSGKAQVYGDANVSGGLIG